MGKEVQKNAEGLTIQDLGPELMLYDAQKDEVHVLNPTARVVWEGLVAGYTEDEIASDLQERFSIVPGHDLRPDIRNTIVELKRKGLIKSS
jgi:hypothetical protein